VEEQLSDVAILWMIEKAKSRGSVFGSFLSDPRWFARIPKGDCTIHSIFLSPGWTHSPARKATDIKRKEQIRSNRFMPVLWSASRTTKTLGTSFLAELQNLTQNAEMDRV